MSNENNNIIPETKKVIEISIEEYNRLKDLETRFEILRNEMIRADFCPIHHQIIFGIENERTEKGKLQYDLLPPFQNKAKVKK